ncbi:MAG: hypothetical protein HYT78_21830 [Deltaproteobacteria bacterium]|nr:hypothetical protein [Deltaproteobacteria bacterium]
MPNFDDWFQRATGNKPYSFQVRFACDPGLLSNPSPSGSGQGEGLLVDVPTCLRPPARARAGATHRQTGLGKTAMAVLGWPRRRRLHG